MRVCVNVHYWFGFATKNVHLYQRWRVHGARNSDKHIRSGGTPLIMRLVRLGSLYELDSFFVHHILATIVFLLRGQVRNVVHY
jgi:hypothetical protein